MKVKILISTILSLIIAPTIYGQLIPFNDNIFTDSLAVDQQKYNAVISSDFGSVLYVGVDNPIQFAVDHYQTLTLKTSEGKIIKQGDKYFLHVYKEGTCTLYLFSPDGKRIALKRFWAEKIPVLREKKDPFRIPITKEHLKEIKTISSLVEELDLEPAPKIKSFVLTVNSGYEDVVETEEYRSDSDSLTDAMRAALHSILNEGENDSHWHSFCFNIIVKADNGAIGGIGPLCFYVEL